MILYYVPQSASIGTDHVCPHSPGVGVSSSQTSRTHLWRVYFTFETSSWSTERELDLRESQRDMGECAAFSLLLPSFIFDAVTGSRITPSFTRNGSPLMATPLNTKVSSV